MDVRRTLRLMVLLLVASAVTAAAQLAPAPDAAPVAPGSRPSGMNAPGLPEPEMRPSEPYTAKPIFPANANLVELPLVARGSKNHLIVGLTKTDCSVEEDDTPQAIQSLTASNDRPLTLGILLDTSLSQQGVLAMEQEASAAFLRRLLHPGDEAFVIGFDVDVTMLS
ncbi:MAG: VWA domain-containing protein, partial [Acidobacteriaceae bacterium]